MADRDKALEDYKAGLSYREIADKHGTSESTVKSWASRYWNKDKKIKAARNRAKKTKSKSEKSCNHSAEKKSQKVATEKRHKGGQPGNQNAVGNQGPLKHGGYSSVYWDTLDEEERELINDIDTDEEYQLEEQLRLFAVRERRILKAIQKLRNSISKTDEVEISSSVYFNFENREKTIVTDEGDIETKTSTKPKPSGSRKDFIKSDFAIARLEKELTGIQRSKTRVINSLAEIRRLKGNNNDDWLDDFFSAIDEVDDEESE